MNFSYIFNELWIYLNILIQVFTTDVFVDVEEANISQVRLLSEWPTSGDNSRWIASLSCPIYLAKNYTPQESEKGFYIRLTLEHHADSIASVFYPFDRNSIVTEEMDGKKVFQINTSVGVWEYKGQKNYEIHVIYTNTVKIHWPQGTCAGPYAFE